MVRGRHLRQIRKLALPRFADFLSLLTWLVAFPSWLSPEWGKYRSSTGLERRAGRPCGPFACNFQATFQSSWKNTLSSVSEKATNSSWSVHTLRHRLQICTAPLMVYSGFLLLILAICRLTFKLWREYPLRRYIFVRNQTSHNLTWVGRFFHLLHSFSPSYLWIKAYLSST
jgi:hypothetical protein